MSKRNYPHVATMLYGAPLMVQPDRAAIIERVFQARIAGQGGDVRMMDDDVGETPEQRAERTHADRMKAYAGITLQRRDDKPYALSTSGIGFIPLHGTLIQRGSWMDAMSGLTGYDEITSLVNAAAADPEVRGIVLDIDSPGGQVNGAFELARLIAATNQQKPVWAQANEQAYSAAYLQASSAARFYVPMTGGTANIGTIAMHLDQTKRDAMMGYTYTVVYAGAQKADMNSHIKLSDRARAKLQAEVDRVNGLFLSHVAEHRSLSVEAVAATEAAALSPPDALDAGLIDGVQTLAETVALLEAELGIRGSSVSTGTRSLLNAAADHPSHPEQENDMSEKTTAASAPAPQTLAVGASADLDRARTEGTAAGAKAERERVSGILNCEEAQGRSKLASHLAMETDTGVEAAKKLLAASALEQAAPANPLAAAMSKLNNPKVGAEGDTTVVDAPKPIASAASVYAARRQQITTH